MAREIPHVRDIPSLLPWQTPRRTPEQAMKWKAASERLFLADKKLELKREGIYTLSQHLLDDTAEQEAMTLDDQMLRGILNLAFFQNVVERERLHDAFQKDHGTPVLLNKDDKFDMQDRIYRPFLHRPVNGISLGKLLQDGPAQAKREPIRVFSHILSRMDVDHPLQPDDKIPTTQADYAVEQQIAQAYRMLVLLDPEEFIRLRQAYPSLDSEVMLPAQQLSQAYRAAVQGARVHFLAPQHPEFPQIVSLYEQLEARGGQLQHDVFFEEVLQTSNLSQAHSNNRKLSALISKGDHTTYFAGLKQAIAQTYNADELVATGIFDTLTIDTEDPIAVIERDLMHLKEKLVRVISKGTRFDALPAENDRGEVKQPQRFAEIFPVNEGSIVQFGIETTEEDGTPMTIALTLTNGTGLDWNIINTPDELPDFYRSLMANGREYLQSVLQYILHEQKNVGANGHCHKKVIGTNSVNGMVINTVSTTSQHPATENSHRALPVPNGTVREIIVEPAFLDELSGKSPDLAQSLTIAVERSKTGNLSLTKLRKPSANGNNLFSGRVGDKRVIAEEDPETGELRGIDVGDRKVIYRKYNDRSKW